jgi:hypothetical protein
MSAAAGQGIDPPPPKPGSDAQDAEQKKSMYEKYGALLKALSIAIGFVLIGLGVFNYATVSISDPMNVILPLYYIIFGCLMIAAEVGAKYITG